MIFVDASDALRTAAQLAASPAAVRAGVTPVVSRGALNVKNDWNAAFSSSTHFRAATAGSVTYDVKPSLGGVEAEIGPDKDRHPRAALANIAHFGGARGGGGTVADPQTFADKEAPKFEAALGQIIERTLP